MKNLSGKTNSKTTVINQESDNRTVEHRHCSNRKWNAKHWNRISFDETHKKFMCATCTATSNEINMTSMFNSNIKATVRNVLEQCIKQWQPKVVNQTQELHKV